VQEQVPHLTHLNPTKDQSAIKQQFKNIFNNHMLKKISQCSKMQYKQNDIVKMPNFNAQKYKKSNKRQRSICKKSPKISKCYRQL